MFLFYSITGLTERRTTIHTHGQFRLINSPNQRVFGLWEEKTHTCTGRTRKLRTGRPELGFKFQTFLLWGNSVYHCAAVSSESIQIKWSSFSLNGWSASLCQSISRTSSLHVPTKRFGAQSLHFSVSTLLKNKNVAFERKPGRRKPVE